jgi:hypothetical protein
MAGTKTADIYINARCKKNKPQKKAGIEKAKKACPAAAEVPCPGRPAGGGAHGNPYRSFGPYFRGPYFFSFFGKEKAWNRIPG